MGARANPTALPTGVEADPIHEAAVDGDTERVERLLDEGADVNAPDDAGTPLQWALFGGQSATARILLEHGADPNVEGPAGTPLLAATIGGDVEVVGLLLGHGADPNRGDRSTPLIAASQSGNQEIAALLLEHGADASFATFDGVTALHKAAERGHLEVARQLVDHGADVNAITAAGKPPIHIAVAGNHADLAAYLREQGAKPGKVAPITDLLASADVAAGEADAKTACSGCHHFEAGKNSIGPFLWNVVGRPRGSVSGFKYSKAFSTLGGDWTFDALNEFLARPAEIVPGTAMNYRGMAEPQKRADLIAYLRTLSDAPVPFP
jgi:cytochrome c